MGYIISIILIYIPIIAADVIQLTNNNVESVLNNSELVFVDFYASWCYFSNVLDPIFADVSNKLEDDLKNKGKIALAKVDCEKEADIAKQYGIRKYPTLKLFRFAVVAKQEYRGARNIDAFIDFIKSQLEDPIKEIASDKITKEDGKSYVIGHFQSKSGANYSVFRKTAFQLRDQCQFYVFIKPDSSIDKWTFETSESMTPIDLSSLNDNNEESMKQWLLQRCIAIVREITFQNAEDITEEGLPLLLLFHSPSQIATTTAYKRIVMDHLVSEAKIINFLYADGQKFSHPLMHLGKTEADLPLIVLDSFQHMFLLPNSVESTLSNPEILKRFISDFNSGRLHREFHNGPDPVVTQSKEIETNQKHKDIDPPTHESTPYPSVFKKLRPNPNRYTLFHDEF